MKSNSSKLRTGRLWALFIKTLSIKAFPLLALLTPLQALPANTDYDIVSCGTRESTRDNGFITRILVEEANFGSGEVQIAEMYFPPGYRTQAHTHGSEEIFYVIEGVFGHHVNGEGRMLQAGEIGIARIGDNVEHTTNEDSSARVLVIWVPGGEWPSVEEDTRGSWEMLDCP